jgi:hypothetical protein
MFPKPRILERFPAPHANGRVIIQHWASGKVSNDGNPGRKEWDVALRHLRSADGDGIPFDALHSGRPWTERQAFDVDDRAVRPGEFVEPGPSELDAHWERDSTAMPELGP